MEQKIKKKIIITTDTLFHDKEGITRFLQEVIPELSSRYDITLIASQYPGHSLPEKFHGATVVPIPVLKRISIAGHSPAKVLPSHVMPYVKNADLVWINTMSPIGAATVIAAQRLKKPVIAYTHSIEWELFSHVTLKSKMLKKICTYLIARVGKYLYNKCDLLMVPSKATAAEFTKQGIHAKKVIVPLGVDCDTFVPPITKTAAKQKLGIQPRKIVIGYCGRISKEKDLPTLAKAFAALQRRHLNLFLLIVGDGMRRDITRSVKRDVCITGFVNDVVPYLQAMDLFVLPSLTETTSLATLEAMSCGVPPVATPVGRITEYIEHNFNGVLFPRQNIDVLQARIERLVTRPEIRERMGNLARKTITTKYSWEKTIVAIEKVLSRY